MCVCVGGGGGGGGGVEMGNGRASEGINLICYVNFQLCIRTQTNRGGRAGFLRSLLVLHPAPPPCSVGSWVMQGSCKDHMVDPAPPGRSKHDLSLSSTCTCLFCDLASTLISQI